MPCPIAGALASACVFAAIAGDGLESWPPGAREAQRGFEGALIATPERERLQAWHELLGSEPHIAGTAGDAKVIDSIARSFREMGLEVDVHEIWPYLAVPIQAELQIIEPELVDLSLKERAVETDPYSSDPAQTFAWNAYSGNGEVTGEVVYANYGTKEDFEKLAALGVDCHRKVVIARYGGNYRGFKAKFAEAAGAAGLVIYTDPADSGYTKGIPYPEGGWANECCVQRGSIVTMAYQGDPLTPFVEATRDAKRISPSDAELPNIPVQPAGYDAAQEIMSRMRGEAVPEGWQGGLPMAYRLTGGPELRVRLKVRQERQVMRTANVIATLPGATHPEELVILGCHHDAWGCGASDPLAGTICLMEAARSFAELARAGKRPARTVLFCAWAAEEFGIIGSSEWVEANRARLMEHAVAYINLDMAAMGPQFHSSAWPSLRPVVAGAMRVVPQARGPEGMTVFDVSQKAANGAAGVEGLPEFGVPGGGSDHVGFLMHAGVPSMSCAAGGSKGWSYHSIYDTLVWYWKVVGEDYEPARMVSRMAAVSAARLANAPVLDLDPSLVLSDFESALDEISRRGIATGALVAGQDVQGMSPALRGLLDRSVSVRSRLAEARGALDRGGAGGSATPAQAAGINRMLVGADRVWLHETGLPGRPWHRNLLVGTDESSGYATWRLPALRYAVENPEAELIGETVAEYRARLDALEGLAVDLAAAAALLEVGTEPLGK